MLTRKRIDLILNSLNALFAAWVVRNLFPHRLVLLWLASFSAVILFRYVFRVRFQGAQHDEKSMRGWATLFTLNAFATGSLWGLLAWVIPLNPAPEYLVFVVFMLVGLTTGGIALNSVYLPAMVGFLLPTVVPVILVLATRGDFFHSTLAGMVTALTTALVFAGRSINRSILENVRLRVEQNVLTDQLRANEIAMAEVQKIAQIGGMEVTAEGNMILWTDEALRILGVDRNTFKPDYQSFLLRVHTDDRPKVETAFNLFLRTKENNAIEFRIVTDNGEVKYVHVEGQIIESSHARPVRFFGTMQDVTARTLEEKKLKFAYLMLNTQMEASPDGIVIVDAKQKVISYNHLFASIWNISNEALAASSGDLDLSAVASLQKNPALFRERAAYLYAHPGQDAQDELETSDGRYIDRHTNTLLAPDGTYLGRAWFFRDITERKHAADELSYRDRLLHAVTEGTRILVKAESPDEGMAQALRVVREGLRVERVLVMPEFSDFTAHPVMRYLSQAQDASQTFDIASFQSTPSDDAALRVWRLPLKDGKPVFGAVDTATAPVRKMLEWFHNKSTLLVPIIVGDRLWGTLAADSTSAMRKWTPNEVDTLSTFGDIAGALVVHHETQMALQTSEERFRVLGATAVDGIITMDGTGKISSWNKAAEKILGYTALEALGQDLHELLTPLRFLPKAVEAMKTFHATGTGDEVGITRPLIALRKDGVEIAIEISMAAALVENKWQAIGILRDVTERKRIATRLQFANILLTTEMEASLDGILVVNENRKILSSNRRFDEIWKTPTGYLESGEDGVVFKAVQAQVKNPTNFGVLVEKLYANHAAISDDEIEMLDGRTIERHTVPLANEAGAYLGRAWFFRDVTERRRAEALAIRSAHFDVLTGLANRSVFVEAVNVAVERVKRGDRIFAVMYLDLDHFKDVNDTLGHPLGDALLMEVAGRLLAKTRVVDTVARFGGDEFAVVLADISGPADAAKVADKLLQALNAPYTIRGNQIYSGASIGIDIYNAKAGDAETLLSHADVALYRAKQAGRNGCRFFTDVMDKEVRLQVALGTELHEALERNEFFLEYQPQVTIADSRIVGVEALVRWQHPTRGLLGPDVFIPIAERSGLILQLGTWVLQTACAQMKVWVDAGVRPIRVAVNVSGIQFKSPTELQDNVIRILEATGLPAQWLELELTETVLMNATREHSDILIRLRKLGVTIAIDDFGTGFSSFNYLRRFPVDRIKIDQNFVRHLGAEPGATSIVRVTLTLGHELGIEVIAEGVETREQLALLRQWGCREVQGFYFSKPLAVPEMKRLLTGGGTITPESNSGDNS
jgi:diguanylate cyclase (GGDEF)-like protein/PAS domain S-box-containing protein